MEAEIRFTPIAHIRSGFKEKFGIPRQSRLADTKAEIIFEQEYRVEEALRGMEAYSHIWLLWFLSESAHEPGKWSPTVRPPRLGGNARMGVFATRSPFRPNPIGLSCVRLEQIEMKTSKGPVLHVSGADLLDGTPIFDIKPYLPYVDSVPEALGGFSKETKDYELGIDFPERWKNEVSDEEYRSLCQILRQDPRPSYQHDVQRIYGMAYADMEIKFTVDKEMLHICGIQRRSSRD